MHDSVHIVLPEKAEGPVPEGLIRLASVILRAEGIDPTETVGLGGPAAAYGADYENDVFLMHHYCWCDRPDCPWCAPCMCSDDCWIYERDGERRTGAELYEWIEAVLGPSPKVGGEDWAEYWRKYRLLKDQWQLVEHKISPDCMACAPPSEWFDKGYEPQRGAPNFWHKSSGIKIWWYKWIGRSMEMNVKFLDLNRWEQIVRECIASIG